MFSLTRRLFSPVSKSWFSTRDKAFECRTRRRIFVNLKEVFAFNMEETTDLVLKADLQFTSIVAHNYLHTQAEDEELRENLVKNVEHRDEDLTPNLALDITTNFKTLINTNEGAFYSNAYGFIKKYCYLFQAKQLDKMEKTYYYLYKKGRAQLNVDFVDLIRSSNNHGTSPTEYTTDGILEFYGIEIPKKHMKVYIYPTSSIIRFNFLKIQKTMTLVGVGDTIDSLKQLANIINEKEFDFFLMGLSPVSQADLVTKKRHAAAPRDIKKHIDPSLYDAAHAPSQVEGKHQHLELFEEYKEMALMDGELTGWYRDNVLNNQELYQPDEDMRVICREKKGLSRIDAFRTILYSLSMKTTEKPKVLFTDMELFDEVNQIAQEMDLEAVKDLFHYARHLWLQEHIRWGITVNKNGCPQCSSTYEELPRDLMEIISKRRYNFSIREKYIANQIVQSLVSFKENKSYIGFYKKNMLPGIMRQISRIFEAEGDELANYSEQAPERTPEQEEQLYELLLRKDDRKEAIPAKFSSEQARKEYTDKFAMLLTMLEQGDQRINVKIPKEADIDHALYAKLRQEYQTQFTVESFIDHQVTKFAKEKGAPQCFASNVIFNKP